MDIISADQFLLVLHLCRPGEATKAYRHRFQLSSNKILFSEGSLQSTGVGDPSILCDTVQRGKYRACSLLVPLC